MKPVIACVVLVVSWLLLVDGQKPTLKKKCLCTKPGEGKPPTFRRDDCGQDCIKCSNLTTPRPHYNKIGLCVQCKLCSIFGQITEKECTESHDTICVDPPPQAVPQENKQSVTDEKAKKMNKPVNKPNNANGGEPNDVLRDQDYNYGYIFGIPAVILLAPLGIFAIYVGRRFYKKRYTPANRQENSESEPQQDSENSQSQNLYENNYDEIDEFQNNHNNYNDQITGNNIPLQQTGNHSTQTEHHPVEDEVPADVHKSPVKEHRSSSSQVTKTDGLVPLEHGVPQDTNRSTLNMDSHSQRSLTINPDDRNIVHQGSVEQYTFPIQVTEDHVPLQLVPSNRTGNDVDGKNTVIFNNSFPTMSDTNTESQLLLNSHNRTTASSMDVNVHSDTWRRYGR